MRVASPFIPVMLVCLCKRDLWNKNYSPTTYRFKNRHKVLSLHLATIQLVILNENLNSIFIKIILLILLLHKDGSLFQQNKVRPHDALCLTSSLPDIIGKSVFQIALDIVGDTRLVQSALQTDLFIKHFIGFFFVLGLLMRSIQLCVSHSSNALNKRVPN